MGRDIFFNCSLFILISQKDEIDDLMNQNAGAILENMLLEATSRNIGSVFVYSPVRIIRSKVNYIIYLILKKAINQLQEQFLVKKLVLILQK